MAPPTKKTKKAPPKKAPTKKVAAKKAPAKKAPKLGDDLPPPPKTLTKSVLARKRAALRQAINVGSGNRKPLAKGHMMRASEIPPYQVIPTGSIGLDYAMGVGGWVRGRVSEVWGSPGMGKTTLCLYGLASAQRTYPDQLVGFIDIEHTFDMALAKRCGVDVDNVDIFSPGSAEEVADILKAMYRSGLYSMIVLDSVGAMIPRAEIDKDADEAVMANQAKIITRMVKIAAPEITQTQVALVVINQVRANLASGGYGDGLMTPGGHALDHGLSHKLRIKSAGKGALHRFKVGEETHLAGQRVAVVVGKNKVAPPDKVARFDMFLMSTVKFGPMGLRPAEEAIHLGQIPSVGAIRRNGSKYTLPDGQVVVGEAKAIQAMVDDPGIVDKVREIALQSVADCIVLDDDAYAYLDDAEASEVEEIVEEGEIEPIGVDDSEPPPILEGLKGKGSPMFRKAADVIDADAYPIEVPE